MNLNEVMRSYGAKLVQNATKSFKQQISFHPDDRLGKIINDEYLIIKTYDRRNYTSPC